MEIIKAGINEQEIVLKLLDDFRTEVFHIGGKDVHSDSARKFGPDIYEYLIKSDNFAAFIAFDDNHLPLGVITINKIPVLRKGTFKAEIEELFVIPASQSLGVGSRLIVAAEEWAINNNISYIELLSGNELLAAHNFYQNRGYVEYAKGFKKNLIA